MKKNKLVFATSYLALSIIIFLAMIIPTIMHKDYLDDSWVYYIETYLDEYLPCHSFFKELYGASNLVLSPYQIDGIVKEKDGSITPIVYEDYDMTKVHNSLEEIMRVSNESGADFAFIYFPSKTLPNTDSGYYGKDTNSEEYRNNFLNWISTSNIPYLDVRTKLYDRGYTNKDIFYKTDHHWTADAGLFAARETVDFLNQKFNYNLPENTLDESNFTFTYHPNLWLGELGRKMSYTWVGALDGVMEIRPTFDTSITLTSIESGLEETGDFSLFIDSEGYNQDNDLYNYSGHYSYFKTRELTSIRNNLSNQESGKKILLIRDSFSAVYAPFLSLATSEVVVWDPRNNPDGLYDYIRDNQFDTVLIAYYDYWDDDMWTFN